MLRIEEVMVDSGKCHNCQQWKPGAMVVIKSAAGREVLCLCAECCVHLVELITGFKLMNWYKAAVIQSGLKIPAAERRRRRALQQERIV